MALLDPGNEINDQSTCEYWQDELKNSRVLLFKINEAIQTISTGNHQSYTLDTGQSRQTVTRLDLPRLIEQREKLIEQIAQIQTYLNEGKPNIQQVVPGW